MNAALASQLARATCMHHANLSGVYQPDRVCLMYERSHGELLIFMHHDDKGHSSLLRFNGSIYISNSFTKGSVGKAFNDSRGIGFGKVIMSCMFDLI